MKRIFYILGIILFLLMLVCLFVPQHPTLSTHLINYDSTPVIKIDSFPNWQKVEHWKVHKGIYGIKDERP